MEILCALLSLKIYDAHNQLDGKSVPVKKSVVFGESANVDSDSLEKKVAKLDKDDEMNCSIYQHLSKPGHIQAILLDALIFEANSR